MPNPPIDQILTGDELAEILRALTCEECGRPVADDDACFDTYEDRLLFRCPAVVPSNRGRE
jgi:hypothetical protein